MASFTPNINLKKPTTSEMYNVLDWNDNSDKIDTAVGNLSSHIVTVKQYSATTETNANVSPWGAYCQISIPSEERNLYGNIFSVATHSASTNPSMGVITSGEGGVMIYSKSPATFNISVGFIKSRAT